GRLPVGRRNRRSPSPHELVVDLAAILGLSPRLRCTATHHPCLAINSVSSTTPARPDGSATAHESALPDRPSSLVVLLRSMLRLRYRFSLPCPTLNRWSIPLLPLEEDVRAVLAVREHVFLLDTRAL